MNLKSIASKVKSSPLLYSLYFNLGSFGLKILKLFVKTDDSLILFNCYGGKKYDDSPKEIFQNMKTDPRFKDCHFVWAFHNPEKFDVSGCEKIKTDTIKYYMTALKAKIWITNSGIERGLSFKGKHTVYFNTHHGTPIKKCGFDLLPTTSSFATKAKINEDFANVQSDWESEVYQRIFGLKENQILKLGLPRNDVFFKDNTAERLELRNKLGITDNSKVVLYAPTFREYNRDKSGRCEFSFPFDVKKWSNVLGDDFIIFFRAHYEVSKLMEIPENDKNIIDVSDYPDLNELIIASDILISDYSSIMFDYSITGKPILTFTYDYDEYAEKRGLYIDVREYFTNASDEDTLLKNIININYEEEAKRNVMFKEKYVQYYGDSTEKTIDKIYESLKK